MLFFYSSHNVRLLVERCVSMSYMTHIKIWIKQMIKFAFKVKVYFFLVRLDIKRAPSSLPKIQFSLQPGHPQIRIICGGEMPLSGSSIMLSSTRRPNRNPPHNASFFFLSDPLPAQFPATMGHTTLEPSSLKPDDAHLTFTVRYNMDIFFILFTI